MPKDCRFKKDEVYLCHMLIDIHTHKKPSHTTNLCFLVGVHSLGIHPWELTTGKTMDSVEATFELLKKQFNSNILAVGECGLDRAREGIFSVEQQLTVLEWHLNWAKETKRPLILHCVRAHSDLLMLLKKKRFEGKILLHDYNGNLTEAMKFLDYDSYFSFGSSFFRKNSKTPQVFKTLPRERLFLETDDQNEFSIEKIYEKACEILRVDQLVLEENLMKNLLTFFGDLNDVSPSDLVANMGFRS